MKALARLLRVIADKIDPDVISEERVNDLRRLAESRRMADTFEMRAEIIRSERSLDMAQSLKN